MTVYRVANLAWQLGGDDTLVEHVADDADVLGLVECRDRNNDPVNVQRILGRGWDVRQELTDGAAAGSVLAVRKDSPAEIRSSRLVLASPGGRDVQARHRRQGTLADHDLHRIVRTAFQHNPLEATGLQRVAFRSADDWADRARRWRREHPARRVWLFAGDTNSDVDEAAEVLGAPHHFGVKPMVACWSAGWPGVRPTARRYPGSDHHVLTLTTQETR